MIFLSCIPVNLIIITWAHRVDNPELAILGFASILLVSYPFMGAVSEKKEKNKQSDKGSSSR